MPRRRSERGSPRLPKPDPNDQLEWQTLDGVEMRAIRFADKPLWQADAFHLLVGRKGMGKGTLNADLASRVTRGELGAKRNVVWIASEDSASIDIKPRVVAAGGDSSRIIIPKTGWVQLPRDVDEIGRLIEAASNVGLAILDPVSNHISGKNTDKEGDIRAAIAPLNKLADEHACMVVGVRHLTEKEAKNGVLAAILGSSAWVQVPRAVIAVVRDADNPTIVHMQCVAGNRMPPGTAGRMFQIEGVALPNFPEEVTRATFVGESTRNMEDMLAGTKPSKSKNARELILYILNSEGEQPSQALDARVAAETNLAVRTIKDLRVRLADEGLIESRQEHGEAGQVKRWMVRLT